MADTDTRRPGNPGPDWIYRQALSEGRFVIQKCASCGSCIHYPRLLCTDCGSDELDTVEASGGGTVYSTSVIRRRPERGGDYNIALVDLDEGPRLMSRVEGLAPDAVTIGMRVKARIDTIDDAPLLVFEAS